jgi:hypothetical protein
MSKKRCSACIMRLNLLNLKIFNRLIISILVIETARLNLHTYLTFP